MDISVEQIYCSEQKVPQTLIVCVAYLLKQQVRLE